MDSMGLVTKGLQALGAGDTALATMGPTLTIILALLGGLAVGQLVKWPLYLLVKGEAHGYLVRICAVYATWCFAHFLSNHLSVPLEVLVALFQPILYLGLKLGTAKYATWLAPLFASVGD